MNRHNVVTAMLILLLTHNNCTLGADCDIAVLRQTKQNSPLLLKSTTGTNIHTFFLPDQSGMLSFSLGQQFIAACPGNEVMVNNQPFAPPMVEITFTCSPNNKWTYLNIAHSFMEITCRNEPTRVTKTTGVCLSSYKLLEIGYETSGAFISIMKVCFDAINIKTYYAEFEMNKNLQHILCPRVRFEEDNQFVVQMDPLYNRMNQQATVNSLLGLPMGDTTYVDQFGKYLSRGHLTAKSDYTYSSHQLCTFFYINTAPQWQILNGGSWNDLEVDVRMFSTRKQVDLKVVTGTFGVLELPDRMGNFVQIFMHPGLLVPVPKYFWKLVYEPVSNKGVVFISTNNPYGVVPHICGDICRSINFIRRSNDIHCCSYQDFRRNVNTFPVFDVNMEVLNGD